MLVSIVVPMKDEVGSLPRLGSELGGLEGLLGARGDRLEVVLVDDGSGDGTVAAAEALCAAAPGRQLLRHDGNRGFGAGLRTGVAGTTGDVVVSYEADCAYPAADVLRLVDGIDAGADIAGATPFALGGSHDVGTLRAFLSRACSFAYRRVLGARARGVQTFTCAFRAYRGDLIRGLRWESDGFLAATEILLRALEAGARVVEVPSSLRSREAGQSKMSVTRTTFSHLRMLSRLAVGGAA